jgi:hypothetical protein
MRVLGDNNLAGWTTTSLTQGARMQWIRKGEAGDPFGVSVPDHCGILPLARRINARRR